MKFAGHLVIIMQKPKCLVIRRSIMKDHNCIFCKIANGEIPSRTVYENDLFRVILDNGPATEGHALV